MAVETEVLGKNFSVDNLPPGASVTVTVPSTNYTVDYRGFLIPERDRAGWTALVNRRPPLVTVAVSFPNLGTPHVTNSPSVCNVRGTGGAGADKVVAAFRRDGRALSVVSNCPTIERYYDAIMPRRA